VQARGHPDTHVALTRDLVERVPMARSVEVAPADTNTIRRHLPRPLVKSDTKRARQDESKDQHEDDRPDQSSRERPWLWPS